MGPSDGPEGSVKKGESKERISSVQNGTRANKIAEHLPLKSRMEGVEKGGEVLDVAGSQKKNL